MKVAFATSSISILTLSIIFLYIATQVRGYVQNGWIEEQTPKEKRYAMLSYNYGGGRNNYYNDYYRKRYRYRTQWKPWLTLPDRRCYRDRCSSDRDCCKRYNKCDAYLKVCLDCWYGSRCQTSADCCYRFPYCNTRSKYCTN